MVGRTMGRKRLRLRTYTAVVIVKPPPGRAHPAEPVEADPEAPGELVGEVGHRPQPAGVADEENRPSHRQKRPEERGPKPRAVALSASHVWPPRRRAPPLPRDGG